MPFTHDEFFEIFQKYNNSIYPIQLLLVLACLICAVWLLSNNRKRTQAVFLFIAFVWLWTGIVYHILFFSQINKTAYVFGVLFIIQALFFLQLAFNKSQIVKEKLTKYNYMAGTSLILYGLLIYPAICYFSYNNLAYIITFGLPCPTTIATFGMLFLAPIKVPKYMIVIPALWSIMGFSAAFSFGIYQDLIMPLSALLFLITYQYKQRH